MFCFMYEQSSSQNGDLVLRLSKYILIAKLYSGDFISLLKMREHKHLKFKSLIFSHSENFRTWYFTPGVDPQPF